MNKTAIALALASVLSAVVTPTHANTVVISGTINQVTGGTSFDTWKINMQTSGTFTVDVRGYEASQSNIATAGYYTSDLNGDGELTWLDPDTYLYKDDGQLDAVDAVVRCDDTANNCPVYQNGLTDATSPAVVTSHLQTETFVDGSIHFRRDPWFNVNLAAGSYAYVVADYRLDPTEAAGGYNGFGGSADTFSAPSGFVSPILDHADYQVTFSSDTLNFAVSGNTITVSANPVLPPTPVREDSDGDGLSDLFWRNSSSGNNALMQLNGFNPATAAYAGTIVAGYEVIGRGDYNGDGKADLLWGDATNKINNAYVQLSSATAQAAATTPVPITSTCSAAIAGSGDYDADGKVDLLLLDSATGVANVLLMDGSTVLNPSCTTFATLPAGAVVKGTGDYNGDGKADILWRDSTSTKIQHTGGTLDTLTIPAGYDAKGSGHYTADANDDILLFNADTALLLDGASHNTSVIIAGVPSGWDVKGTGYYNHDAFADIVWRNGTTGGNYLMLMNGSSILNQGFVPGWEYLDPTFNYAIAYTKTQR